MISRFDRRKMLKGAAGATAGAALLKASPTYANVNLIQGGPTEVLYWGSYSGNLGEAELALVTSSTMSTRAYRSTTSSRAATKKPPRS